MSAGGDGSSGDDGSRLAGAAAQIAVALVGSLDTVGQSGSRVGLGAAVLSWAR